MDDYLESGSLFNRSRRALLLTAVLTGLGFVLFCAAVEYYVAQYFVCIGNCRPGTPPLALVLVSGFFALIPALGTGVIGYWIVKGLWDDARQLEAERQAAIAAGVAASS